MGKLPSMKISVPAPTGTWLGHSDSLCVVQKLGGGKMELSEVQKSLTFCSHVENFHSH